MVVTEFEERRKLIAGWGWCTDNIEIMEIFHYWIGMGRGKDDMQIGEPFFLISSTDPQKIVTIWEDNEGGATLTKGETESYFDTPFDEKTNSNRRGSVLEAFARIEFVIDYLLLICFGVYSEVGDPHFTLRVIRTLNVNRKIDLLRHRLSESNIDFSAIDRIRKLRNQMAHQYSVMDVEYNGHQITAHGRGGRDFTNMLNDDYRSAINGLFESYYMMQQPVINWMLFKLSPRKKILREN